MIGCGATGLSLRGKFRVVKSSLDIIEVFFFCKRGDDVY